MDKHILQPVQYVGFWPRVWASLIDTVLLLLVSAPLAWVLYVAADFSGQPQSWVPLIDPLIYQVLPICLVLGFWVRLQATPGKMVVHARIVDADTCGHPRAWQWVVRYLGYFPSVFCLGLGLFWVGFDHRKQGWHDKLARTVVVKTTTATNA